jgi:hypothetical protein
MAVDASSARWWSGKAAVGDFPWMTPFRDIKVLWNNPLAWSPRLHELCNHLHHHVPTIASQNSFNSTHMVSIDVRAEYSFGSLLKVLKNT